MTAENQPDQTARHGPARRAAGQPDAGSGEVASQLGDVAAQLATQIRDPGVAHSIEEIEEVTRGFSAAVEGMAAGLGGITEWLRASGHAGSLSGHSSVVQDRLAHASKELARFAEAVNEAEQANRAS